ncbi:hypothetical protein QTP86_005327 [Hemibagrus guttatus]|nr:hypothetical protein QTP86_005327 [Hemibagrus guttatus]
MDPIGLSSSSSLPGLAPPHSSSAEEIAGHTSLPPSLPPFGGVWPSRAEVVAHLDYASGDIAQCCCSAVDVVQFCCSVVDVARLPCSAVDVARRFCSAVDVDSIQRKRLAKKKWDMDRTEENRQEYKELQCRVKREVSKAKQKACDKLYTRLDTREGQRDLYSLARQRDRDGKDVQQVRVIKDRDGRVRTSEESVQRRWKEYFEELMNEENEREKRVEGVNSVEQKVDKIRKEGRKALKSMKSGKAVGPDDIPVEIWKCLGEAAVEFLTSLFNRVLESEKMPEEWRRSVLVLIFKNKGDVQSAATIRG